MTRLLTFYEIIKFHWKRKIAKCKMQIMGRKLIYFSIFNFQFDICNLQ